MSTQLPGFQSFFRVFSSFCIGEISYPSSIRVKAGQRINGLAMAKPTNDGSGGSFDYNKMRSSLSSASGA